MKDFINVNKRQATDWQKILVSHASYTELYWGYNRELSSIVKQPSLKMDKGLD